MASSYNATAYQAPKVLTIVRNILDIPRAQHSKDFAEFIATDSSEHDSYRKGLIGLACIFGGILFAWGTILLILKCKGRSVGCASGRAFQREYEYYNDFDPDPEPGSTDIEEGSIGTNAFDGRSKEDESNKVGAGQTVDDASFHSSIPSSELDASYIETESAMSLEEYSVESEVILPSKRERRTQAVFLIFALITLACVPLALVYFFTPLKDAADSSELYVEEAREVVNEVRAALTTVSSAANNSEQVLQRIPLEFSEICPLVSETDAKSSLGVELDEMLDMVQTNYVVLDKEVSGNVSEINDILSSIDDILGFVEKSHNEAERYMWVVPGILLGLCVLTGIAMIGVVMAWKRDSSRAFQRLLSYGILPFLLAFSITCWVIAIAMAVTTVISSDACTQGTSAGTPDATIQSILQARVLNSNSTIYKYVSTYTKGCVGEDPTRVLATLENQVQSLVDFVWRYLSLVDSQGRSNLVETCGGDRLEEFLAGVRDIGKLLTSVRKAIDSVAGSLQCDRINPIYLEAVHDSMCTDVASASAWGFLIFFVIGISSLCMITLRASWRHKIKEDKIYDEDEVAENMILDEHEEYLAYISRYKHEWQEYRGLDTSLPTQHGGSSSGHPSSFYNSTSESEISTGSRTELGSGDEEPPAGVDSFDNSEVDKGAVEEPFDPYLSATSRSPSSSTASGEISFLSLRDLQTPTSQQSSTEGGLVIVPPPLLERYHYGGDEDVDGIPPPLPALEHSENRDQSHRTSAALLSSVQGQHSEKDESLDTDSFFVSIPESDNNGQESIEVALSSPNGSRSRYTMLPSPTRKVPKKRPGVSSVVAESNNTSATSTCSGSSSGKAGAIGAPSLQNGKEGNESSSTQIGSLGAPGSIQEYPKKSPRSSSASSTPSSVQFNVDEEVPTSHVMRQVDLFSKSDKISSRPPTPPRLQPAHMKDLAAKFDSPEKGNKSADP